MNKQECLNTNPLFAGLSPYQLQKIVPFVSIVHLEVGQFILHENEISNKLYILVKGELEVVKAHHKNPADLYHVAILHENAVVGELSTLDNAPCSASVRATQSSILFELSLDDLRSLSAAQSWYKSWYRSRNSESIYGIIIRNLAKCVSHRLRLSNDSVVKALGEALEHTKARLAMGNLIIATILLICIYIYIWQFLKELDKKLVLSAITSIPSAIVAAFAVFIIIKKSKYPLSMYGLTFKNGWTSLKEGVFFTLLILPLLFFYKWVLIQFSHDHRYHSLFEFIHPNIANTHKIWIDSVFVIIYLLMIPLQELTARGVLQGAFETLIVSPHRVLWGILLSNLVFGLSHIHLSVSLSLLILLPGLFWGWLYSRHRTLVGVIASHYLIGFAALATGII